jgi:hypothetical protein
VLAGQARILGRDAGTVGAVAAGAGRHVLGGDATAPDVLAQVDGVLVLGRAGLGRLGGQVGRDVDVLVGQPWPSATSPGCCDPGGSSATAWRCRPRAGRQFGILGDGRLPPRRGNTQATMLRALSPLV